MKISTKPPGWAHVVPVDHNPDVSCEIKIFNIDEGFEFDGDVRIGRLLRRAEVVVPVDEKDESKGTQAKVSTVWNYYSPLARDYFKKFVRNIEGLVINGVEIKTTAELFDPSVGHSPDITLFLIRTLQELFEHNTPSEDEGKNSGAPSGDSGAAQNSQTEHPEDAT